MSLIAAGRTYAGALESAAELVRGDERVRLVLAEAASMLLREPGLRRQARS